MLKPRQRKEQLELYMELEDLKLNVMRRSIRNFNIPPGIHRAFDCASCPGRGRGFERCL